MRKLIKLTDELDERTQKLTAELFINTKIRTRNNSTFNSIELIQVILVGGSETNMAMLTAGDYVITINI